MVTEGSTDLAKSTHTTVRNINVFHYSSNFRVLWDVETIKCNAKAVNTNSQNNSTTGYQKCLLSVRALL